MKAEGLVLVPPAAQICGLRGCLPSSQLPRWIFTSYKASALSQTSNIHLDAPSPRPVSSPWPGLWLGLS